MYCIVNNSLKLNYKLSILSAIDNIIHTSIYKCECIFSSNVLNKTAGVGLLCLEYVWDLPSL